MTSRGVMWKDFLKNMFSVDSVMPVSMCLFCSITKEVFISNIILMVILHEKCSEFYWSVFFSIRTEYGEILRISPYSVRMRELPTRKTPNKDTFHAVLLLYFRQLLLDCGIGVTDCSNSNEDALNSAVVSQHRALVFCQLKSMLDLVENTLLKWESIEFTLILSWWRPLSYKNQSIDLLCNQWTGFLMITASIMKELNYYYLFGIFLFKVSNGSTRKLCEISPELKVKTPKWRHLRRCRIFVVNFEQISSLFLMFPLLDLNK